MVRITDYFKPVPRRLNLFRGINKKIVFFMKDKMAIIMQHHHSFTKKEYQMRMTDYYPTIIFNTYDFGQTKITNYFSSKPKNI
jgi:hypothetical protein